MGQDKTYEALYEKYPLPIYKSYAEGNSTAIKIDPATNILEINETTVPKLSCKKIQPKKGHAKKYIKKAIKDSTKETCQERFDGGCIESPNLFNQDDDK